MKKKPLPHLAPMNRSRRPLNEKQRLPTRRVRRSFTVRTPEPVSSTAMRITRGTKRLRRYVRPLRGERRRARGAVRSTTAPATTGAGAPAAPTATVSAFERIAPSFVALSDCVPACENTTVAFPAASVVAPPTLAPATGAPLFWSSTRTATGAPAVAVAGPLSRRSGAASLPYANSTSSPSAIGSPQDPSDADTPFLYSTRNAPVAGSNGVGWPPTWSNDGLPRDAKKLPDVENAPAAEAAATAAPRVGTGTALVPWLAAVASHSCAAVSAPAVNWNARTSVVTGPSNTVLAGPSIRSVTVTGAAAASEAGTSSAARASARPARRWSMEPPLSTRAIWASRSGQVSWLPGLPPRAFPDRRGRSSGPSAAALVRGASPVTVAGPRRTLTGFPRPPTLNFADGTLARPVTVNLTRIYTRLGDGGETHLGDMSRVPKTHPRIEAYGAVDELNAQIGLAITAEGLPERFADWMRRSQSAKRSGRPSAVIASPICALSSSTAP